MPGYGPVSCVAATTMLHSRYPGASLAMPSLPLRRRQMMTKGEHFRHPGRRWQPCVAPYFADRGVGDMRGPPDGAPNMPPRRWWQAVIAPHNDVLHKMIHATPRCKRQPRTTSGVRLRASDLARPACRHDPAWRNTGLRTAATTSGVAEMLASGHRLRRWQRCGCCACW